MKRLITFLLPALFAITACTIDEGGSHVKLREGETLTSFSVILPAEFSGPESYAANITDDEDVKSFHVFAFDKDDKLAEYALPEDFDPESPSLSFNVKFSDLTIGEKYTFMVLANIGGRYESLKSTLNGNPSRGDLRNALIMNESQVSNFRYIPMWGEQTVNSLEAEESITELNLLRMMARINVTVGVAPGVFKLTSVHLFNRNTQGYLIPAGTSFGDVDPVAGSRATTYDSYSDQNGGVADGQLTNMIYTFESEVPLDDASKTDFGNMHALVIGGEYEGGDETYYRVNFCKVGDDVTYLPLLRNYDYTINITKVNSAGYKKIEDAFDSNGLHMIEADVIPWDGDGKSEIAFDGQYWVSIPQKEWTLEAKAYNAAGGDNTITIKTNWTGDIDAAVTSGNSWLGVVEIEDGIVNQEREFYITASANPTGPERSGDITLKVGRLRSEITVRQSGTSTIDVESISIDQEDIELELNATFPLPDVTIEPSNATNKGYTWTTSSLTNAVVIEGNQIKAVAVGTATVTVTSDDDDELSASFEVTVINPTVVPINKVTLNYTTALLASGKTVVLQATVLPANATQTFTWKTSPNQVVQITGQGNSVTVTANNAGTSDIEIIVEGQSKAKCEVTVPEEIYIPKPHGGWAGSNIYWDNTNQKLTFDDVGADKQYHGVLFKWGSLWGISPFGTPYDPQIIAFKPGNVREATGVTWANIPYINPEMYISPDRDWDYLADLTDVAAGKGDICRYLTELNDGSVHGKKWRMPTSNDMANTWGDTVTEEGTMYLSNVHGTTESPRYWPLTTTLHGTVRFNAITWRHDNGNRTSNANDGLYWTTSPRGTDVYYTQLATHLQSSKLGKSPDFGYAVRCVVDTD